MDSRFHGNDREEKFSRKIADDILKTPLFSCTSFPSGYCVPFSSTVDENFRGGKRAWES
jgi:hypothetical protein